MLNVKDEAKRLVDMFKSKKFALICVDERLEMITTIEHDGNFKETFELMSGMGVYYIYWQYVKTEIKKL